MERRVQTLVTKGFFRWGVGERGDGRKRKLLLIEVVGYKADRMILDSWVWKGWGKRRKRYR